MAFHLLVVEDSTADARLIRLGVARCGDCTTAFAENGEAALSMLHREPPYQDAVRPDLILLDVNLPRVSGHQLLAMLLQEEDLRSIPVVVFSGSPNPQDRSLALANGARAYVVKPSSLEPFVEAVALTVRTWMEKGPTSSASSVPDLPAGLPADTENLSSGADSTRGST